MSRMAVTRDRNQLRSILGVDVASWTVTPSSHLVENMTTDSLDHVTVTLADGNVDRAFAKTIHPASASPLFEFIPPEHHAIVLEQLNWLDEPRVYGCGLESDMPEGIRLPKLLAIDRACDDRLVLWLEEVDDEGGPWNLERYRRSARGLGRMTGRWPEARVERNLGLGRRSLHYLFYGKMMNVDLPLLADDATWGDPAVREVTAADPKLRESGVAGRSGTCAARPGRSAASWPGARRCLTDQPARTGGRHCCCLRLELRVVGPGGERSWPAAGRSLRFRCCRT